MIRESWRFEQDWPYTVLQGTTDGTTTSQQVDAKLLRRSDAGDTIPAEPSELVKVGLPSWDVMNRVFVVVWRSGGTGSWPVNIEFGRESNWDVSPALQGLNAYLPSQAQRKWTVVDQAIPRDGLKGGGTPAIGDRVWARMTVTPGEAAATDVKAFILCVPQQRAGVQGAGRGRGNLFSRLGG